MQKQIILATTNKIEGKNHEVLGMVQGNVVMAKHLGRAIGAGFKQLAGGEIKTYTDLLNETRGVAIGRMLEQANAWNADAIIGVRLETCSVMDGCSEVTAYGTAVKFI